MKRPAVLAGLATLSLALAGCILVDLIMIPFQLLFGVVQAVGSGVGSVVASNVVTEPIDGPAPTVTPTPDGRWLVRAAEEPSRFRVTVSAAGRESRTYTWPDDFRDVRPDAHGVAEITCALPLVASGAPVR